MNVRQATTLALMCAEWDGALTHLRILRQVGCRVSDDIVRRVTDEATDYAGLWSAMNNSWWTYNESVKQARTWLADHQEVMEDLLVRNESRYG